MQIAVSRVDHLKLLIAKLIELRDPAVLQGRTAFCFWIDKAICEARSEIERA